MLGTAEADAFGAERARLEGIAWNVGIGADAHATEGLSPAHELEQLGIVGRGVNGFELAVDDPAGGAVEGNPVAGFEGLACNFDFAVLLADVDVAGSGNAALAHTAGDNCGVAGHAAARGENAAGDFHAVNVFRRGFGADEDELGLGIFLVALDGFVGGKYDLADSGAG